MPVRIAEPAPKHTPGWAAAEGALFHRLRSENDLEISTRDGSVLVANVFRPDADGRYPAIITLGPSRWRRETRIPARR